MEAAIRGGFTIVEFTLNTPGALELIEEFATREGITVGAGTVLSTNDARAAVAAGAQFLVSPVVDEEVIRSARKLDVAIAPGTYTATEMWRAHRAGALLHKLFPCPAAGPDHIRALLGPLPFLRIVPTSGVDGDNAADFLAAGAFAVGFVASLFAAADLAGANYAAIEARARAFTRTVAAVDRAPRAKRDAVVTLP